MHLHVLASGSRGNATIVEGDTGSVLIDCGLSCRELESRARELEVDLKKLKALLITHEHSDHVSGVSVFERRYGLPIYASEKTMQARKYLAPLSFTPITNSAAFEVAGMQVKCFPLSHDVADPIAFRFEQDGDSIAYCTDTGVLLPEAMELLSDARILALESNHDIRMLETGAYPSYLKERIKGERGHLSNEQASEAALKLVGENTRYLIAMHLSQENNRPSLAIKSLARTLGAEAANTAFTQARRSDGSLHIYCAGQGKPLSLL